MQDATITLCLDTGFTTAGQPGLMEQSTSYPPLFKCCQESALSASKKHHGHNLKIYCLKIILAEPSLG